MEDKEGATDAEDAVVTHCCVMLQMKGRTPCLQHFHGKMVHSSSGRKILPQIKCLSTSHCPSTRETIHEIGGNQATGGVESREFASLKCSMLPVKLYGA
jgi:hypothetical protein